MCRVSGSGLRLIGGCLLLALGAVAVVTTPLVAAPLPDGNPIEAVSALGQPGDDADDWTDLGEFSSKEALLNAAFAAARSIPELQAPPSHRISSSTFLNEKDLLGVSSRCSGWYSQRWSATGTIVHRGRREWVILKYSPKRTRLCRADNREDRVRYSYPLDRLLIRRVGSLSAVDDDARRSTRYPGWDYRILDIGATIRYRMRAAGYSDAAIAGLTRVYYRLQR